MEAIILLILNHPRIAAAFSIIFGLLLGAATVITALDTISVDTEPAHLSMSAAADVAAQRPGSNVWVVLSDGYWDCATIKYSELASAVSTDLLLVDDSNSIIVIASFNKHLSCDEIRQQTPSGFLHTIDGGRRLEYVTQEFQRDLEKYGNQPHLLDLCMSCTRGNSYGLQVIFGILTVGVLAVYPLSRYYHHKYIQPQSSADQFMGPTL